MPMLHRDLGEHGVELRDMVEATDPQCRRKWSHSTTGAEPLGRSTVLWRQPHWQKADPQYCVSFKHQQAERCLLRAICFALGERLSRPSAKEDQ